MIDSSPQRSQITLTCIGASDGMVIPVEVSVKGLKSSIRTFELINELKDDDDDFGGSIIGVLPFRDRWVGLRRTKESQHNLEAMTNLSVEFFNQDLLLASIRESEKYKQAMNQGITLHQMNQDDLAYPIEILAERIQHLAHPSQVLAR